MNRDAQDLNSEHTWSWTHQQGRAILSLNMKSSHTRILFAALVCAQLLSRGALANGNLLTNGHFESGTLAGWTYTAAVWAIGEGLETTSETNAVVFQTSALTPDFEHVLYQRVPVTAGESYSLSALIKATNHSSGTCRLKIDWLNAGGSLIGSESTLAVNGNQPFTLAAILCYPANSGAVTARVGIVIDTSSTPPSATDRFAIDDVTFVKVPTVLLTNHAFQMGNLGGWIPIGGSWQYHNLSIGPSFAMYTRFPEETNALASLTQCIPIMGGGAYALDAAVGSYDATTAPGWFEVEWRDEGGQLIASVQSQFYQPTNRFLRAIMDAVIAPTNAVTACVRAVVDTALNAHDVMLFGDVNFMQVPLLSLTYTAGQPDLSWSGAALRGYIYCTTNGPGGPWTRLEMLPGSVSNKWTIPLSANVSNALYRLQFP